MIVRANSLNLYARWRRRDIGLNPRHVGFAQGILGKYGFAFSAFPRSLDMVFRMSQGLGSRTGDIWHNLMLNLRLQLLQNQYQLPEETKRTSRIDSWEREQTGGQHSYAALEMVLQRFREYLLSADVDRKSAAGAGAMVEDRTGTESRIDMGLAEDIIRMYLGGIEAAPTVRLDRTVERGAGDTIRVTLPGESRAIPLGRESFNRYFRGSSREKGIQEGAVPAAYMVRHQEPHGELVLRQGVWERALTPRATEDRGYPEAEEHRRVIDRYINTNLAEGIILSQIRQLQTLLRMSAGDERAAAYPSRENAPGQIITPGRVMDITGRPGREGLDSTDGILTRISKDVPGTAAESGFPVTSQGEGGPVPGIPSLPSMRSGYIDDLPAMAFIFPGAFQPGRDYYSSRMDHLVQRATYYRGVVERTDGESLITPAPASGYTALHMGLDTAGMTSSAEMHSGYQELLYRTLAFPINQEVINKGLAFNQQVFQNQVLQRVGAELLSIISDSGSLPAGLKKGGRRGGSTPTPLREDGDLIKTAARYVWSEWAAGGGMGYPPGDLVYRQWAGPGSQGVPREGPAVIGRTTEEGTRVNPVAEPGMAERIILGQLSQVHTLMQMSDRGGSIAGPATEGNAAWRFPDRGYTAERAIEADRIAGIGESSGFPPGEAGTDAKGEIAEIVPKVYPMSTMRDRLLQRDTYHARERVLTYPGTELLLRLSQGSQLTNQLQRDIIRWREAAREARGSAAETAAKTLLEDSTARVSLGTEAPERVLIRGAGGEAGSSVTQVSNQGLLINQMVIGRELTYNQSAYLNQVLRQAGEAIRGEAWNFQAGWQPLMFEGPRAGGEIPYGYKNGRPFLLPGGVPDTGEATPAFTQGYRYQDEMVHRQWAGESETERPATSAEPVGYEVPAAFSESIMTTVPAEPIDRGILNQLSQEMRLFQEGLYEAGLIAERIGRGYDREGYLPIAASSVYSLLREREGHRTLASGAHTKYFKALGNESTTLLMTYRRESPSGKYQRGGPTGTTPIVYNMLRGLGGYRVQDLITRPAYAEAVGDGGLVRPLNQPGSGIYNRETVGVSPVVLSLLNRWGGLSTQVKNQRTSYAKIPGDGGATAPLTLQRQASFQGTGTKDVPTARPAGRGSDIDAVPAVERLTESRVIDRAVLERVLMERRDTLAGGREPGAFVTEVISGIDQRGWSARGTAMIVHNLAGQWGGSSAQLIRASSAYPRAAGDGGATLMAAQQQSRDVFFSPLIPGTQARGRGDQNTVSSPVAVNTLISNRYATDPTGYERLTAVENVVRQLRGQNEGRYSPDARLAPTAPLDHRRETPASAPEGRYITSSEPSNRHYIQTETNIDRSGVPAQNGLAGVDVKRIADQIIREVEQKTRFDRKRRGM